MHRFELRAIGRGLVVSAAIAVLVLVAAPAFAAPVPGIRTSPVAVPSTSAAVAPAKLPGPQLSIAIDNGQTSAIAGDKLTYTVTVKNLGANAVTGLVVSQTMPTGLKFVSADSSGTAKAGAVSWKVNLKAAATSTFHTTMTVVTTPKELLRLASVACASITSDGTPIVCAAHSDQLPAGAAQVASGRTSSPDRMWWYVGGGIGVIVILALAALLLRRRRRTPA